jgi:4-hydroxyphenylpyruvate dioxygenase-like putative hemolysin
MGFLDIPDTYYDQLRKRLATSPVKVGISDLKKTLHYRN